jgi:hypothetical protein
MQFNLLAQNTVMILFQKKINKTVSANIPAAVYVAETRRRAVFHSLKIRAHLQI